MTDNLLYYGDNLDILRRYVKDESVDLVYLDPPFNSQATYNVLFAEKNGSMAASQIQAFSDTWTWTQESESIFAEVVTAGGRTADCLQAFRKFLSPCDLLAYLVMMAPRLVELHRVMKPTASIYLHCDPTASHYLKVLMDAVFKPVNYRNEISWRRSNPKSLIKVNFPNCRDVILRYSKGATTTFKMIYVAHDPEYIRKAYKYSDANGQYRLLPLLNPSDNRPNLTYEFLGITRVWRWTKERMEKAYKEGLVVQLKPSAVPQYKKYLKDSKGRTITDDWSDIPQAAGNEHLGYPTQKPTALLERIIKASSNEGDIVLDPFCGCGTTIAAAQKLTRRWIGIDITHLAITLIKRRLEDSFGESLDYQVIGEPVSVPDAKRLAESDPYQFQWWALGLVGARPVEQKKGADKGIDGRIVFQGDKAGVFEEVILSVKAGKTGPAHIRDLKGVLEREKAAIGVLITLQKPTADMKTEAVTAGFYGSELWGQKYPKIQIYTIEELLAGKKVEMPPIRQVGVTFKKAPKARRKKSEQLPLM